MRKRRLYWTLQVLGWSAYALINIVAQSSDPLNEGAEAVRIAQIEVLVHTPILFLVSHFGIRKIILARKWVQKDIAKIILPLLGIAIFVSIAVTAIVYLMYSLFQTFTINNEFFLEPSFLAFTFFILYVFWLTIYILYHYLESNNKSLKYEAAANEMQLNQLKSQLNPHFIFNALNSMRALVDENPGKAKIAITQLSNILRTSLIMDKMRVVDFNEELNTVRDYLALETIRFEERLQVKFDIDRDSEKFQIPPMMMQTLVENAIKHGVSNLMEGGIVEVNTQVENSVLKIQIRNSGQLVNGVVKRPKQGGYGLANTKQRLKLIYGEEASFKIFNENDKFVITEVRIPQRI